MGFLAKFSHYYTLTNLNRLNNMMGQHTCSSSVSNSDEATFCSGTGSLMTGVSYAGQSQSIRKHDSAQLHGTALPSQPLSWELAFVSSLKDVPASWLKQQRPLLCPSKCTASAKHFPAHGIWKSLCKPPSLIYFPDFFKPKEKMSCLSCLSFLMSLCNRIT